MNIKEYLDKNLPNLNFNILPQILEENGVELTEEIIEYLKNSPWNTNWNVLGNWGVDSDEKEDSGFPGEIILQQPITEYTPGWDDGDDWGYSQAKTAIDENVEKINVGDRIQIFIENVLWYEVLVNSISSDDNGPTFQEDDSGVNFIKKITSRNPHLWFKSSFTHNLPEANVGAIITVVRVEIENENNR